MLIVVAFILSASLLEIGAASAAAATGRALRLHMLANSAFVFVTFVARPALSTKYAVSNLLRDVERMCVLE